jgi:hypothetical protein
MRISKTAEEGIGGVSGVDVKKKSEWIHKKLQAITNGG